MISATSLLPSSKRIAVSNSSPFYSVGSFCFIPLRFGSKLRFGGNRASFATVAAGPMKMEFVRNLGIRCFKGCNDKVLKVEVDSGSDDVFDAAAAEAGAPPDHLVIMVNGIVGSSADWKYAAEQFVKKLADKVIVHRSESNYSKLTFDGIDLMGERVAKEVLAVVKNKPEVQKISFVAHSLGGLVARYAVVISYEHLPKPNLSGNSLSEVHLNSVQCPDLPPEVRIAGLQPMNFIKFATPHLGSKGNKQRRASQTAHLIVGRTGKHLFLSDNDSGTPPLLLQMVNDSDDLRFISALRAFKRHVVYANASYDYMVGWRTSSIRNQNELPKPNFLVTDKKYPHIVYVELETTNTGCNKASNIIGEQTTDLEEEMIKGLTHVPWERVDVSFQKSRQWYIAHSTIQVKTLVKF